MRPCTSTLSDWLAANNFSVIIVDLFTFSLTGGETLRYSGGNTALTIPADLFPDPNSLNFGAGQTFALGPRFGRSKVTTKVGVEPAELDVDIIAGADDLVGTFPFADAVRLGLFDGATVELDRFFAHPGATDGSSIVNNGLGVLTWFYGRVAETDIGRSKIAMKVKSLMNLLAVQQMPRRIFQAACGFVFGDQQCGYDRVNGISANGTGGGPGQANVTALAGSSQAQLVVNEPVNGTNYAGGTITATTGANAGHVRTVRACIDTRVVLMKPWLLPVSPGDVFAILPGCDHTYNLPGGCLGRHNQARYGGFPWIPPPEQAY